MPLDPIVVADAEGNYTFQQPARPEEILELAASILEMRMRRGEPITQPEATKEFLVCRIGGLEHEVFSVVFLDNRHRVICFEELFRGTIDGASVHPREVVKRALALNAAAVILAHNHPSGESEPSEADKSITRRLQEALKLVEIRVLDHIVVGGAESTSFAERGLI